MNVKPKKHLGQHFLRDLSIAKRIADTLVYTHLPVLEIGPGTGILTQFLLQKNLSLYLVEIDTESIQYLKNHFSEQHFTLFEQDILTLDITTLPHPMVWIGNLPYNISSQIFFKLWENDVHISEAVFMVQREVALRIAGKPNSKEYGILSVLLQLEYDIAYKFTVPPQAFYPPPKVYSGVLHFVKKEKSPTYDKTKLLHLVKTAFQQRRKTLKNSIKSLLNGQNTLIVQDKNLLEYRAEQLSPQDFLMLLEAISKNI